MWQILVMKDNETNLIIPLPKMAFSAEARKNILSF